jgi:hypothetical protein
MPPRLRIPVSWLILSVCTTWCAPNDAPAGERVLEPRLLHLRIAGEREWTYFPEAADAESLVVTFDAEPNAAEHTLRLRQQDVKLNWTVDLNGRSLGRLFRGEPGRVIYLPIPAGRLVSGENTLMVKQIGDVPDDIYVGEIALFDQPVEKVLAAAHVEIEVFDGMTGAHIPGRITVLDASGAQQTVGAVSNDYMAVRPGVIYTGNGRAQFGLPAGRYTIYAGRGFEYGIDSTEIEVRPGETIRRTLTIRREVSLPGYVSCDTHVHTLTHSGHGDATMDERMLTIPGEGIELPIAADHNKHIDYEEAAVRLGVRQYFTPVVGNEVTTKVGHFNIFPVPADTPSPDHTPTDWDEIFANIYAVPGVRAVILNHARDVHSGVRPFGPKLHNALVGENLDGWTLRANAMEVVNSGAQQTDGMRLYHDWFGLLNRGLSITPVGSSDSHDVARSFIGQGRTYIRSSSEDPGKIDVNEAVENFVAGRVLVSAGLLADIEVDGQYGPGDLVSVKSGRPVSVTVRVLGPSWVTAEAVALYANGRKIREAQIPDGKQAGVKWSGTWELSDLRHDVHLVAVAHGPGVRELYWPIGRPYQPTSPHWEPEVIGSTGAVWVDVDGDGKRTSAWDYARQLMEQAGGRLPELIDALRGYDEAVAAQAANLLEKQGVSPFDSKLRAALQQADERTRRGFQEYAEAWRENQQARLER